MQISKEIRSSDFKIGDRVRPCGHVSQSNEVGIVCGIINASLCVGFRDDFDLRIFREEDLQKVEDSSALSIEEAMRIVIHIGMVAAAKGYDVPSYISQRLCEENEDVIQAAFTVNRERQLREKQEFEAERQRDERRRIAALIDATRQANGGPNDTLGILETADALRSVPV